MAAWQIEMGQHCIRTHIASLCKARQGVDWVAANANRDVFIRMVRNAVEELCRISTGWIVRLPPKLVLAERTREGMESARHLVTYAEFFPDLFRPLHIPPLKWAAAANQDAAAVLAMLRDNGNPAVRLALGAAMMG